MYLQGNFLQIRRPRPSPRPGRRLRPPQVWTWDPPKPSKPSKHRPQQAPQGQGHFPNRHPRAKATAMAFYGLSKLPFASRKRSKPPNPPNPPNSPKPSKPSKHSPQQAPQGQGHFPNRHPRAKATAMAFYWLSKLPFASPQTLQTLQNPPNPPNHPKPSKPSKTLQTLQTPSPAGTPGPRPLPQQAPQGQGHSIAFYGLSKLPFASPQTLQTFQNLPNTVPSRDPRAKNAPNPPKPSKLSKPSKTLQTLQTPSKTLQTLQTPSPAGTPGPRPLPQQAPQGQGHSIAFYGLSKLPFASPQTLQTFQNLPNPPNPPKLSKPSKHRPQQGPQGQGYFPNRHPRAKATAMAFYWLSKLPFASPQTLQTLQNPPNPPKPSKPSKHPPKPSKPSKTFQTFQTPSKPSKHPPKPSKPSKHLPQQAPQGQGHFSNRHPRAKATA